MSTAVEEYPDDLNPFDDEDEGESTPVAVREQNDKNGRSLKVSETAAVQPTSPAKSARGTILKASVEITLAVPEEDDDTLEEATQKRSSSPLPVVVSETSVEPITERVNPEPVDEPACANPFEEEHDAERVEKVEKHEEVGLSSQPTAEKIQPKPVDEPACANPFEEDDVAESDEKVEEQKDLGFSRPPTAEKILPKPVAEPVCANPFDEDDDENEEKAEKQSEVGRSSPSDQTSSARSTPIKATPFDPPPRPPPPKILTTTKTDYDDSLNPFAEDDEEETVPPTTSKPPAPPRSPRKYKKKTPAPPPPSTSSPLRSKSNSFLSINSDDERPRSASRLSNASLDSAGAGSLGTPHRKKKPAPNAPIPPKRVFPDGFKDKLQRELADVDVKMEQLRRQQDTIKRQLAFFGIDDMDLSKTEHEKEEQEEGAVNGCDESDYESRVDSVLEAGSAGDTGSEVSGMSSLGKNEDEDDAQTTERIVEKLTLLQEIGEELEELMWRRKEVAFDLDDYALNEQHAELEHKIRVIQAKASRLVTPEEKEEEARLIEKLMRVVERRDALVEKMEQERNARRILILEATRRRENVAVSAEDVSEPKKKHKKYKIPKLKSKTLKKIKEKMHHHHGKESEDAQKRSSKKS